MNEKIAEAVQKSARQAATVEEAHGQKASRRASAEATQASAGKSAVSRFCSHCVETPTVVRALITALIVGPVLTVINQYDAIVDRDFGLRFFLKLILIFAVPYAVSMSSSALTAMGQIIRKRRPVTVTIYPIAGRQLFFRVPERFCQECELTVRAVQRVLGELGSPPGLRIQIKPWLIYFPQVFLRGGWHPPVVTIDGRRFSQGVVPDIEKLRQVLQEHLQGRRKERDDAAHSDAASDEKGQ